MVNLDKPVKNNKLSVYVPNVENRMLEDIAVRYNLTTSAAITKAISAIYPQAALKIKITDWALCAMLNNRFDLLTYLPEDSNGIVTIGTDFVEIPDKNGNTNLVGTLGENTIDAGNVVKTWTKYNKDLKVIKEGINSKTFVVHMLNTETGKINMEVVHNIEDARRIALDFYVENKQKYPDGVTSEFKDNIRYNDVYSIKYNGNVIIASITPA